MEEASPLDILFYSFVIALMVGVVAARFILLNKEKQEAIKAQAAAEEDEKTKKSEESQRAVKAFLEGKEEASEHYHSYSKIVGEKGQNNAALYQDVAEYQQALEPLVLDTLTGEDAVSYAKRQQIELALDNGIFAILVAHHQAEKEGSPYDEEWYKSYSSALIEVLDLGYEHELFKLIDEPAREKRFFDAVGMYRGQLETIASDVTQGRKSPLEGRLAVGELVMNLRNTVQEMQLSLQKVGIRVTDPLEASDDSVRSYQESYPKNSLWRLLWSSQPS